MSLDGISQHSGLKELSHVALRGQVFSVGSGLRSLTAGI